MTKHPIRTLALAALLLISGTVLPAAASADAGKKKTETLRFFSQPKSFTYTAVDGTVTHEPPAAPPQVGDVFEIDSVGFAGNHRRHAKRPTMSDYLRCTFVADGPPDCFSWVAIGGSMLRFHGSELIGGGGRYLGATGKVVKNKEVPGGSDLVAKIKLR